MDLIRFGLIPEFTGRISVITSLTELTEADLMRILQEPKNALVKQYQKMFELENVELKFTTNALKALAARAIKLETGARGLRSVMESIMLDIMYTLPSTKDVAECVINKAVVEEGKEPLLLYKPEAKSA
jgi:ATP-dependent Clp protease ATP-binding subunit ClpX